MEKIKCITFDKEAQDNLPQHIKDKMKSDRENENRQPVALKNPYDVIIQQGLEGDYIKQDEVVNLMKAYAQQPTATGKSLSECKDIIAKTRDYVKWEGSDYATDGMIDELCELYAKQSQPHPQQVNLQNCLDKAVGLLLNIRHETDYMPDSYYEWIDKVIHEIECEEWQPTPPKSTGLSLQECKEPVMKTLDEANGRCSSCGGRTALVLGQWVYRVDGEPYQSGRYEESESQGGTKWLHGFKCDDCEQIQGIWSE